MDTKDAVTEALFALTGIEHSAVQATVESIERGFAEVRIAVGKLLASPDELRNELGKNGFIYTDREPYDESVFAYFDLAPSVELQRYVARLRLAVADSLDGGCDIRFTDVGQQHCTAFIEMLRRPLGDLEALIAQTGLKYADSVANQSPFVLWVGGPHLVRGGIVLECTVGSTVVTRLRDFARKDQRFVPENAGRSIHSLLHSTVAYIAEGSADHILNLQGVLDDLRMRAQAIPVYVREARVIGTRNRRLVGNMVVLRFQGRDRALPMCSPTIHLNELLHCTAIWAHDPVLARRIVEVALRLTEHHTERDVLRAAHQLLVASWPYSLDLKASLGGSDG